ALGGVVLATLGPGWAFLLNAISYGAIIVALLLIRAPGAVVRSSEARPPLAREFAATVRYARARPGIWVSIVVVMFLGLFGSPLFTLLVVFARDVFDVGRGQYGLLGAALGIGALLGTPFVAGRSIDVARGPMSGVALVVYSAAVIAFALAPGYWFGMGALVVAGACFLTLASTMNTTIQLKVDEAMRGKVISVYLMGLTATVPLGALVQGWLVEVVGPRATVAGAGALLLAAAVWLVSTNRFAAMDAEVTLPVG
ncbi:MAG: MFS transporter, partial [Acidimicrobiales bacterium]